MGSNSNDTFSKKNELLTSLGQGWDGVSFINLLLAASFSLAVFIHFLDFFLTPTWQKAVVFTCLLIYFFVLSLFFVTPIIRYLVGHKNVLLLVVLIGAALATGIMIFSPSPEVTIRTAHTLVISVPEESGPVTVSELTGPMDSIIPLEDLVVEGTLGGESVALPPGGSLTYTREMTGGLTLTLSAPAGNALAIVRWDDQEELVSLVGGARTRLQTDPTSGGVPSRTMRLFLIGVKVNEWLIWFLILTAALGELDLVFHNEEVTYQVNRSGLQRYLMDYLILGGVLILIAVGGRFFLPESAPVSALVLAPGAIFLILKLLYLVTPILPLVLIGMTLSVNLFANITWFDRLLSVRLMVDGTFNELAINVNPDERTMMSIGFYRQLRGADLIVPLGTEFAEEDNVQRLIRINILNGVTIADYPGELTTEEYDRVMTQGDWSQWEKRLPGAFYFYRAEDPITSPIVLFTYRDDVLLISTAWTDDLGLLYDSILD